MTNFTALDWSIVCIYLAGILVAGLYCRRYVKSMAEFVVAGRSLKSYLAIATLVGSELGLVTVMYSAQKGFTSGFSVFHIALSACILTLLVGLTGFIVVPLRRMGVMTIPEFYERRFSRGVRILGGAILAVSGILNMGMFLKAGAIFITGLTGMESAFQLNLVMTVMLGMVLAYTMLGGMLSVVFTDYLQFVLLSVGLLITCGIAVHALGWDHIKDTAIALKGEAGVNPLHPDGGGVSYVIWMAFMGLFSACVWQTAVMRACSAASTAVVKRLYIFSSIGFLIRFLIPYFFGICALVYFSDHETLKSLFLAEGASSETTMKAMPLFLSHILPTGLLGLVAAGMLAAFMSTHDSYLLCWSSVLTQDVVAPCIRRGLSTRARLKLTRAFTFLIGVFLLVWSLWYPLGQDLWDYMAITGSIYFAGAFALLLLGIYWKRASTAGAYVALVTGFLAVLGLTPVKNALGLVEVGSHYIGLSSIGLSIVLMVVVSLVRPDKGSSTGEEETT